MEGEQLGQDDTTDFLALSFSTTDVIGHKYGPQSIEVQDTYLRLDHTIAQLLRYLDAQVGRGNSFVFLTADHGAADVPSYLDAHNGPGGYFQGDSIFSELKNYLGRIFSDTLAMAWYNQQIYFNPKKLKPDPAARQKIYSIVKEFYYRQEGVARVFSAYDLKYCKDVPYCRELAKGYWPQRSGEIVVLLQPGWIEYSKKGTTHGSPYPYDTHVPLLFYGRGIKPGRSVEKVGIGDIAPTIATMLGIGLPSGSTGIPLKFD
jgi:predicted AlkP superfamily pyrophosphatase or phosphodiesterase